MEITVFIERGHRTENITFFGTTVQELLKALSINPETVIVVRNNEVITEDVLLQEKEKIEILSVISGG